MKYKHILEVHGREWFDKVNGNSYFSACIVWDDKEVARLPIQYGYGNSYQDEALSKLVELKLIKAEKHSNGSYGSLWRLCDEQKIKLIANIKPELKKYVKSFGE